MLAPPQLATGNLQVTWKSLAALHGAAGCNARVCCQPSHPCLLRHFIWKASPLSSGVNSMYGVIVWTVCVIIAQDCFADRVCFVKWCGRVCSVIVVLYELCKGTPHHDINKGGRLRYASVNYMYSFLEPLCFLVSCSPVDSSLGSSVWIIYDNHILFCVWTKKLSMTLLRFSAIFFAHYDFACLFL